MTEQLTEELTLHEAYTRYVRSLGEGKPDVAAEVTRFARWFGGERAMRSLRPSDIERYGEETSKNPVDAAHRLESVRGFLAYSKKQGITDTNLGSHLRLRRSGSSDSANAAAAADRIEVTADGLLAMQTELASLHARRPQMSEELRLAMADKDFRENAPLDAAREKQAHLEARIREIEATLKRAVVVESGPEASGRARMGSIIRLKNLSNDQEVVYTLVGPGEVDAGKRRISVQSPVGRALVNRSAGDEVEVTAPAGVIRFRLEAINEQ